LRCLVSALLGDCAREALSGRNVGVSGVAFWMAGTRSTRPRSRSRRQRADRSDAARKAPAFGSKHSNASAPALGSPRLRSAQETVQARRARPVTRSAIWQSDEFRSENGSAPDDARPRFSMLPHFMQSSAAIARSWTPARQRIRTRGSISYTTPFQRATPEIVPR
jgi:hypothetical protein